MMESKCFSGRMKLLVNTLESLESNTWTSPLCLNGSGWTEDKEQHDKAVEVFHALAENTSCPTLIFQNATIDDALSVAFSKAVCQKQQLRTLTLRKFSLPQQAGEASLYSLPSVVFRNHPELKSLSLSNVEMDEEACVGLCQMLRDSKTLTSLSLDALTVDPQGLVQLFAAIALSPSLNTLRLSNMRWSKQDLTRMFCTLSYNRTITYFSVECMHLDAGHAEHVAKFLRKNQTVTTLSLRKNNLDAAAVNVIVDQGLKLNLTLRELYLSRNELGIEGAACLAKYLVTPGSSVQTLCLVDTKIPKSGCSMILHSLRQNTTLRSISLDGNDVLDLSEQLLLTLDVNTTLTQLLERLPALAEKNDSQLWKQVDFYLSANKAGRRFLKEQSFEAKSQYMPQLLRKGAAASPDVLFYFLVESGPSRLKPVFSALAEPHTFVHVINSSETVKQKSPVPQQCKTISLSV